MGRPTARLTDITNHGGVIISGSHDAFTLIKPNARVSDLVACPIPGHGVHQIISGAPALFTNNLMQSRIGDLTACGSCIASGDPNRLIGDGAGAASGEVSIGAIYDPDTKTTIVYTMVDSPHHETEMETAYKPSGDSSLGVTTAQGGKPVTSTPPTVEGTPSNVDKKPVGDLPVDKVKVDDSEIDYSMQLSPNFKLSDLTTNTALSKNRLVAQHGLTKEDLINNLKKVAVNSLEPIAAKYGRSNMVITSGFRIGSSSSQHERGMAVDIQFKGQYSGAITDADMVRMSKEVAADVNYDQFILEYLGKKPWMHISYSEGKNRRAVMSAVKGKGFVKGIV